MQLNTPTSRPGAEPAIGNVRARLGLAVLSLLGAVHGHALAQSTTPGTVVDGAVMNYKESGGRVSTTEAVVHAQQTQDDGSAKGLKLTFDTLSGGSPNGALPSKSVQTFARPSGKSGPYTVAPGALPLDPSFRDQRVAGNVNWSGAIAPQTRLSLGGSLSHETDFLSVSGSATVARDYNQKNTTLSAGVNLEADAIRPTGGVPLAMSLYSDALKDGSSKRKQVGDLLLGVSQVLSRRWITQLNWSMDKSSGYQNDPYKIVSQLYSDGTVKDYLYENRPGQRTRNSLYWGNKFALDHDTVDFSWRHMSDDWGIKSDTLDLRYRYALSDNIYIEPQYRYYKQSAANFYHLYLTAGDPAVAYASADPRLAKFHATTLGLKVGMKLNQDMDLSLRVESYKQSGHAPDAVPSALQGLQLYPGLKAQMVEAGLKVNF